MRFRFLEAVLIQPMNQNLLKLLQIFSKMWDQSFSQDSRKVRFSGLIKLVNKLFAAHGKISLANRLDSLEVKIWRADHFEVRTYQKPHKFFALSYLFSRKKIEPDLMN